MKKKKKTKKFILPPPSLFFFTLDLWTFKAFYIFKKNYRQVKLNEFRNTPFSCS